MNHGTTTGCAATARSTTGTSPRKGRRSDPVESTGNGVGRYAVPEYPEEELATIAKAYRVPLEAGPIWCAYDRAMSVWRQRVLALVPMMLATPDAFIAHLSKLKEKKNGQPVSMGWELEQRGALGELIDQIMQHAIAGQTAHGLALEINSEVERNRRHPVILELAHGGWLPKPPTRPDCRPRVRDPKDEATRQASAERLASSFFDEDAPEPIHDARARAAGEP